MAKRYPPKLKFQIVLEIMKRDKSVRQIAKQFEGRVKRQVFFFTQSP